MKKVCSILLCCLLIVSGCIISSATTFLSGYRVGDVIEFGAYPQTLITDEVLIDELSELDFTWIDYGYYQGTDPRMSLNSGSMKKVSYMYYADVEYQNTMYRAVYFTEYRPTYTYHYPVYSAEWDYVNTTHQPKLGYFTGNVYWFKYEPLEWYVISPQQGLLLCRNYVDSQPFNNESYPDAGEFNSFGEYRPAANGTYFTDLTYSHKANLWEYSSIRKWLNEEFYNTAFSTDEKAFIELSDIQNYTLTKMNTEYELQNEQYTFDNNTLDYVYLLSYSDTHNLQYGLCPNKQKDGLLYVEYTDYAECQGGGYAAWSSVSGQNAFPLTASFTRSAMSPSLDFGYHIAEIVSGGPQDLREFDAFSISVNCIGGIRPVLQLTEKFSNTCSCLCHSDNPFFKFIFKIVNFFNEVFSIKSECPKCEAIHYTAMYE